MTNLRGAKVRAPARILGRREVLSSYKRRVVSLRAFNGVNSGVRWFEPDIRTDAVDDLVADGERSGRRRAWRVEHVQRVLLFHEVEILHQVTVGPDSLGAYACAPCGEIVRLDLGHEAL